MGESMKAFAVYVLFFIFLTKTTAAPAPTPPAPWLNDKDCASALNSYNAFSLRRWYRPLRAGMKSHCMQDPAASKRGLGYSYTACKMPGVLGPPTLCAVSYGQYQGGCCPPQCCYDTCENFYCPPGLTKKKNPQHIYCTARHQPPNGGPYQYACSFATCCDGVAKCCTGGGSCRHGCTNWEQSDKVCQRSMNDCKKWCGGTWYLFCGPPTPAPTTTPTTTTTTTTTTVGTTTDTSATPATTEQDIVVVHG